MTVSNTTNKYQWTGNGVTTGFAFSNIFFAKTDLLVTLYNTSTLADVTPAPVLNGAATYDYTITATLNADTGEYPSGTVVFTTAPPSTYRVTIERVVPQTQSVTLIDNSKFPANTVNGALDRLTILSQRNAQLIAQALYYPSSDPTTVTNILPDAGTRASMYLAFDASGNPIASPGTPGSTPISAFWATTVQLATALLSRAALAVPGLGDDNTYTGTQTFGGTVAMSAKPINEAHGADIASSSTVNLTTSTGNVVDVTGTTTITALTLAEGAERTVRFTGILTLTNGASLVLPGAANITTAAGDIARFRGYAAGVVRCEFYSKLSGAPISMSRITNALSGNVALNNTANYFTGPTVAQGTDGVWFASGTVSIQDTGGAANMFVKLWDGTTVIASTAVNTIGANTPMTVSLSGVIASPAGNITISVRDTTATTGLITFNASGNSKDAILTAIRIG